MRSRQLNFYLNAADQIDVNDILLDMEDLRLCSSASKWRNLVFLDDSIIREMGSERLKIFLLQEADVASKIQFRKNEFVCTSTSSVIEYSRCYISENFIRRGRLYLQTSYYNQTGELVEKPETFTKWAERVFLKIKSNLVFDNNKQAYFGKGALSDLANGVEARTL